MILTLTLNPSIDRTVELVAPLQRGAVQRAGAAAEEAAAGKGVNVTRVLSAAGVPSRAIVVSGAHDRFASLLDADGVDAVLVPGDAPVRTNLSLTEADGTTTKVNEPGAPLAARAIAAVLAEVRAHAAAAEWLVIAGSLPIGARPELIVEVVEAARAARPGIRIAVDTSGAPLAAAVAGGGIDLAKPNEEELEELLGLAHGAIDGPAAAAAAARALVQLGVGTVLLTLGASGAMLADTTGVLHATPPPTAVRSTVGAGDASLAGWLIAHARGDDSSGRLQQAVAHGSAAAAMPGTGFPTPEDADASRVAVRSIEAPRPTTPDPAAPVARHQEH
ncbi:hexose kinase [Agrococcus sp. 1P02AA]|uniref:1-phosphofructokinase family hexose kinase n=1 Tax=Agrococcus sp. 1P02AA TaxID=3132259 RepID=UPI0039A6FFFC